MLGFCCAMTVKVRARRVIKGRVQQMKQLEKSRGLKVQSRQNGDAAVVLQWVQASGKVHLGFALVAVSAAARAAWLATRDDDPSQASKQAVKSLPPTSLEFSDLHQTPYPTQNIRNAQCRRSHLCSRQWRWAPIASTLILSSARRRRMATAMF